MSLNLDIKTRLLRSILIDDSSQCWNWIRGKDKNGYGKIHYQCTHWRAHRLMFHIYKAPLNKYEIICHSCDNPSCINPDHLFLGDPLINMQDKVKKGRLKNQNMNKTHCKNGHEFFAENIVWRKTPIGTPSRSCKICYVNGWKERNAKKSISRREIACNLKNSP